LCWNWREYVGFPEVLLDHGFEVGEDRVVDDTPRLGGVGIVTDDLWSDDEGKNR